MLLETLVAVSIFTVSALALLSILSQGITSTGFAKKKVVGAYLAEEGIEMIRNQRDTLIISSATAQIGWEAFVSDVSLKCSTACYVDDSNTVSACGSGVCSPLLYDSSIGQYNYTQSSTSVDSGFIRTITITPTSVDEYTITSLVSWPQGSASGSVSFSESLFNWVE